MIPLYLHSVGTHAFPAVPIEIDFRNLPPLICLYGPNGHGKTTVMDLITGALYLTMPFRPGPLAANFVNSGHITLHWLATDGMEYHSQIFVDVRTGRVEATLHDPSGEAIAGPLQRDYMKKVVDKVASLDLWLCTAYAVQTSASNSNDTSWSFLRAKASERREIFAELIALSRYERWAEKASEHGAVVTKSLISLRSEAAVREAAAKDIVDLSGQHAETEIMLTGARHLAAAAAEKSQQADLALTAKRVRLDAMPGLTRELESLAKREAALTEEITDLGGRIKANQDLLAQQNEIYRAFNALGEIERRRDEAQEQLDEETRENQVVAERTRRHDSQRHAAERARDVERGDLLAARTAAGFVDKVPCHGEGVYATCPALISAAAARERLPAIEASMAAAVATVTAIPSLPEHVDRTPELRARRDQFQAQAKKLIPVMQAKANLDVAASRVEQYQARIAAATQDLFGVREAIGRTQKELDALTEYEKEVVKDAIAAIADRQEADKRAREVSTQERALGELAGKLKAAQEAGAKLVEVTRQIDATTVELQDWSFLERGCGPKGIPILRVDEALPDVSRLATELIRVCYGESVYDITLASQRQSADEKRLLEALDVLVRRGTETVDAGKLSGGEGVLVSEALALAISLYRTQRTGMRLGLLMRDEVAAPLDTDRAITYVDMLRRAAEVGHFAKILFVSHQPSVIRKADARLHVLNGTVSIE